MKKTLMTCLAIVAVFAIASSAGAVTCTIDQRPAATLLVPYFQVSFDPDGNLVTTGIGARDTIVTIANASGAPMIAHVSVFTRYSQLALDFNVALTAWDVQAMRMSDVITGLLPDTVNQDGEDACQRNPDAEVYFPGDTGTAANGFLRVRPLAPVTSQDNSQATTDYNTRFILPDLVHDLRFDCVTETEDLLAIGYLEIDMANYCNLSDPTVASYWYNDAAGMENNLWGEIIFTSGFGIPTYALSTVNLEADPTFGDAAFADPFTFVRTHYAKYWDPFLDSPPTACPNCNQVNPENDLLQTSPWNVGFGDQREALGLNWAARWFDGADAITSNFRVWRSSLLASPADLALCEVEEPTVTLVFWDEDENTTQQGTCPSPCENPLFNFPNETQQRNVLAFSRPSGAVAGWVEMLFSNGLPGGELDQAWVDYSFEGAIALETILVPGTQLDPSNCNPMGVVGVQTILPVIPSVPTGTGSVFIP
jgi:hypothetical protein